LKILKNIFKSMLTNVNLINCMSKTRINVNSLTIVLQDLNTPEQIRDIFHVHLFKAACCHSVTVAAKVSSVRKAVQHDANNIW
jgi:hypothetical protein